MAETKMDALPALSDEDIDMMLRVPIPGGAQASHWFLPHDTERGLESIRVVVWLMCAADPRITALAAEVERLREAGDAKPSI